MTFQAKLRSVLDSNLAELSTARKSIPRQLSDDEDSEEVIAEVISLKKLRLRVRDDWQRACEEYTASHEGNQLDEDLITGYTEGAVREYILDTVVSLRCWRRILAAVCLRSLRYLDNSTMNLRPKRTQKRSRHSTQRCSTRWISGSCSLKSPSVSIVPHGIS